MKQFITVILQYCSRLIDITVLECALKKTIYLQYMTLIQETIPCRNCIHDFINSYCMKYTM